MFKTAIKKLKPPPIADESTLTLRERLDRKDREKNAEQLELEMEEFEAKLEKERKQM